MKKWIFPMLLLSFSLLAFVPFASADDRNHRGRRGLAVQTGDHEHSLRAVADRHDRRHDLRHERREHHRKAVRHHHRSHRYNDRYRYYNSFYTDGFGIFLNYGRSAGYGYPYRPYGYRNGWSNYYGYGRGYGTPGRYGGRCR